MTKNNIPKSPCGGAQQLKSLMKCQNDQFSQFGENHRFCWQWRGYAYFARHQKWPIGLNIPRLRLGGQGGAWNAPFLDGRKSIDGILADRHKETETTRFSGIRKPGGPCFPEGDPRGLWSVGEKRLFRPLNAIFWGGHFGGGSRRS